MKRLIIAAGLILALGTANEAAAQKKTTNKKSNVVKVTKTSSSSHAAKATKQTVNRGQKNSVQPIVILQDREYMWPNGQVATPTGNEATPVGGGYAALKKDTVAKKENIPE